VKRSQSLITRITRNIIFRFVAVICLLLPGDAHNFSPEALITPASLAVSAIISAPVSSLATGAVCAGLCLWRFIKDKRKREQRRQEMLQSELAWQKKQAESASILLAAQNQPQKEKPKIQDSVPDKSVSGGSGGSPEDDEEEGKEKKPPAAEKVGATNSIELVRATINNVTKVGSAKEIAKWIDGQKDEIFKMVRPALDNLVKYGNQIKRESVPSKDIAHVFSEKHLNRGIMRFGHNIKDIFLEVIKLIEEADATKMLAQGSNTIRTCINGINIEVRTYLEGDLLRSIDAFSGHSNKVVSNLIKLAER